MFDFIYKQKRLVQTVLALITLPFAFFGVNYYFRGGASSNEVARVSGDRITQQEFDNAMREQQERMRQQLGSSYDPAVFDNPQVRYALLEQLIGQRVLDGQARHDQLRASDDLVRQYISRIPAFQVDGQFSPERYQQLLAQQNPPKSSPEFVNDVRRALIQAPLQEPITAASIVATSSVERYLALLDQKREVAAAAVSPDAFGKGVKIDDAAVKAYYEANPTLFQTPEQAKIEYVTLTPDALSSQVSVDAAEVRKQYDDNLKQYVKPEERRASHILVAVKPDASAGDKAAARKKADQLAAEARRAPGKFAELAKANSQDPGSAEQGGDLGFFARDGSMVKPFEDAVFSGKEGDIIGPVQTDFGWHVIKVTAVKPAKTQTYDEVKAQIEQDVRRQKAMRKFNEAAEQFQNLVYEQADSLQPVAKTLDLKVQTSPLLTRAQIQTLGQNKPQFVQAVFSPDSLQAKRNTDAIEVAPNTLMAARVVEYKPAAPRAFDDVKADIRRQLERKAASEAAQKAGREKLALLEQGKDAGLSFGKPVTLSRNQPQPGFPPDALGSIFQGHPAKLPAYVGLPGPDGGFVVYEILQVIAAPAPEAARVAAFASRVGEQLGRELFAANVASLKAKADVKINQAVLDKEIGAAGAADAGGAPQAPRRR
ncbi:MAG TPA: SurA N-terminal domain-containing protein [Casimicrobiaceae bacterium]|nr:SurA N-terminal domain-containing protein [Casimicrobiaceae bacterium]